MIALPSRKEVLFQVDWCPDCDHDIVDSQWHSVNFHYEVIVTNFAYLQRPG
jgi:hypothetical protein